MDIAIFFGLLFFSFFLAYFYFAKSIIYLGVLSAVIIMFIGIMLAATGNLEQNFCFSNIESENTTGAVTEYTYGTVCHAEPLSLSRDFINAMGLIMLFIGAGMVVSFSYDLNRKQRVEDQHG
jgi:hypothetical protein